MRNKPIDDVAAEQRAKQFCRSTYHTASIHICSGGADEICAPNMSIKVMAFCVEIHHLEASLYASCGCFQLRS